MTIPPENQKLSLDKVKDAGCSLSRWAQRATILRDLRAIADSIGSSTFSLPSMHGGRAWREADRGAAHREGHWTRHARVVHRKRPRPEVRWRRPSPHDLRRTVRTHLEDTLGFREETCERVLNHKRPGIVDTYARGPYFDARREALLAWDAYVKRLLSGAGAKVVALPKAVRS